jgi:glutathione S-transferase
MMRHIGLVSLTVALALLEYAILGLLVGQARGKYNVPAPATTGDPIFERYFRVHQNTMEQLVMFVPAVFIFAIYVNGLVAAALGLLFVIARAVYARGYIGNPEKRATGAAITFVTNAILVLGSLIGIVVRAL